MSSCRAFVHRFSRVFLFITNVCVALIGALALGVGIWGLTRDRDYTNIGDGSDTNYNAYPIVLVVAGSLILILGAVGFLGAICGNKALGRILLFFYAIAMGIIVLLALAGGIAAYVRRDDLEEDFRESAESTLNATATNNDTGYLNDWNTVQTDLHCCGANNYEDWANIRWYRNESSPEFRELGLVPVSCCSTVGGCNSSEFIYADDINSTDSQVDVWDEGCVDAVVDRISDQIGVIAGVSITVAVLLVRFALLSI